MGALVEKAVNASKITSGILSVLLLATTAAVAAPPPPAKIALTGGRIISITSPDIEKGTILIENGKITAIGVNVTIPYDAMEIDVTGKVLIPGMVDAHTSRGLDRPNESLPVTPFLDVYDAIDPSQVFFEDALRNGVTSIHVIPGNDCVVGGLSRVVHPIGLTPEEMTQQGGLALKLSVSARAGADRMLQMALMRETFLELADYLGDLSERTFEASAKQNGGSGPTVNPQEARRRGAEMLRATDYDDKHANLVKLTGGQLRAFLYCQLPSDVGRAVATARANGYFDKSVLVLGNRCYEAIDEIKAAGRPVILDANLIARKTNPFTGKVTETFVPKVFADAGVPFSLLPSPNNSLAERYLNYQAARCVREGIDRRTALEAITITPAKALGMEDRIGSLEVGKIGNVVVLSGDPLDFNSWVELVYINGIRAYDREKDVRLKRLFGTEDKDGDR